MSSTIRLIIGLGNKGSKYEYNRHNIGFRVVEELAARFNVSWTLKDEMERAQIKIGEHSVYLVKPMTFMNSSGRVLAAFIKKGIKPDEVLVVHDELEKPFGALSSRLGGSARGHNGLRSIISVIGPEFWRFRFGVGRPENREDVPDYVLEDFSPQENARIASLLLKSADEIEKLLGV
jgi:PTH1 family peptidyl-tRNA hydrolase